MCGRLNQYIQLQFLSIAGRRFGFGRKRKEQEDQRARKDFVYNICPTDYAEVLTMEDGEAVMQPMRFGLIPKWATGSKTEVWRKFMLTFNARSETVFDLASYRRPIRSQRCLIPVRGWHEWPDRTTPYYIHRTDDEPLLLAGIWDRWESHHLADDETGPIVTSMSIITTPPGRYMGKFHDRSPLVLDGEEALSWLQPGVLEADLREFMRPRDDSQLEAYRVSTAANKAKNKTEEVIEAIARPVPQGDEPMLKPDTREDLQLF